MTALIVGGAGFIGLSIAEHLLSKGEGVVLFDRNALNGVAAEASEVADGAGNVVAAGIRPRDLLGQGSLLNGRRIDNLSAEITEAVHRERG